jgi:Bacterial regulatory protein, Fis family
MSDDWATRTADKYIPRDGTLLRGGLVDDSEAGIAHTLARYRGNVTEAADELGIDSAELRRMIQKSEALQAAMTEVMERNVDKAVGIIRDGMDEESYLVRFYAAKEFLRTETGRRRGFGQTHHTQAVEGGSGGGRAVIVLKWLDDDKPEPKTIEQIEGPLK